MNSNILRFHVKFSTVIISTYYFMDTLIMHFIGIIFLEFPNYQNVTYLRQRDQTEVFSILANLIFLTCYLKLWIKFPDKNTNWWWWPTNIINIQTMNFLFFPINDVMCSHSVICQHGHVFACNHKQLKITSIVLKH